MKKQWVGWVALVMFGTMSSPSVDAGQIIATTLSGWSGGAVSIGDKEFTLLNSSGIDGSDAVTFVSDVSGMNYIVAIGDLNNNVPSTLVLDYTVRVLGSSNAITSVDMDTDIPFKDATVNKSFFNRSGALVATLTSSGSPTLAAISPVNFLTVHVTGVGANAGTLFSLSDSYHQEVFGNPNTIVPEPSTVALLGMGGFGLVLSAIGRRSRKNAQN